MTTAHPLFIHCHVSVVDMGAVRDVLCPVRRIVREHLVGGGACNLFRSLWIRDRRMRAELGTARSILSRRSRRSIALAPCSIVAKNGCATPDEFMRMLRSWCGVMPASPMMNRSEHCALTQDKRPSIRARISWRGACYGLFYHSAVRTPSWSFASWADSARLAQRRRKERQRLAIMR